MFKIFFYYEASMTAYNLKLKMFALMSILVELSLLGMYFEYYFGNWLSIKPT